MPKPAGLSRKAKPEVMPRCCRLVWVLSNRNQPKAITAATARIWKIQARAWGSVNSEPCRREEVATGIGALSRWPEAPAADNHRRSEEHTSELQSRENLVCRLLLEKKKKKRTQ